MVRKRFDRKGFLSTDFRVSVYKSLTNVSIIKCPKQQKRKSDVAKPTPRSLNFLETKNIRYKGELCEAALSCTVSFVASRCLDSRGTRHLCLANYSKPAFTLHQH